MVRTWIVVADGTRARLFSSEGGRKPITELEGLVHPDTRLSQANLSTDGYGRTYNGNRQGSHGLGAAKNFRKYEATQFARQIAERLNRGLQTGSFNHLMLVASPSMLGSMRESLSPQLTRKVLLELNKDLTRDPVEKIRAHLPAYLPTATL